MPHRTCRGVVKIRTTPDALAVVRGVQGTAEGVTLRDRATIGYYRQDFHNFDFESTVRYAFSRRDPRWSEARGLA